MCLFLLSVIPAFAEEGTSDASTERGLSNQKGLSDFGKENKDLRERTQDVKERRETQRENFKEAKEKFQEAKENFMETRDGYRALKKEIKNCGKDKVESKSVKCQETLKKFRGKAKTFFAETADKQIALLNNLKTRIEASDLENKQELLTRIDNELSKLQEIKATLNRMPENPTDAELKDVAELLKREVHADKDLVLGAREGLLSTRLSGIVERAEKLETKLDKVLERLKATGQDTSAAQKEVDEFKKSVASARENHNKALAKFKEGTKEASRQGHELLKEAHKDLKEAHEHLKALTKQLRSLKQGKEELDKEVASEETKTTEPETTTSTSVTADTSTSASVTTNTADTTTDTNAAVAA